MSSVFPVSALGREGAGGLSATDPRLRIVTAAIFAVICVSLTSLIALLLALAGAVALAAGFNLPAGPTARRMAAMDGFILFLLISLPFTVPGAPLFTLWGLTASLEGLTLAMQIALKSNAVILSVMALVGTVSPVTLGSALHALHVPGALVHLLLFTTRYIGVLQDEYARLRLAMRARAFRPANTLHTYRSFGYLVGMMLIRALDRSDRIMEAMKCRGFDGRLHVMARFRLAYADWIFVGVIGLGLLALIGVEWWLRAA
ncbi:cobalt ECF transporter T component CbiQ [Actibacterium sp. 188UL27-1]|uniref:cobalt ECF transporter T component CbiQ n=1 Tax=Actibacterium sp. 188UL27-1 TaxID=2786961 RepID=UPI00195D19BA|nr:cobalt ECF transporter T component CbiQ [Actibacterium sp. 188UL27-1]MBM7066351.1 cobalt ECF transporter T component CbiQ [Actibacterium sp. 188UL27-1]